MMREPKMHESASKYQASVPPARQLSALFLLPVVLLSIYAYSLTKRHTGFDHTVWYANEQPETADDPRAGMVDDLIMHRLKIGMPRPQARALLGNPDASAQSMAGPEERPVVNDTDAYSLGFIGKAKDISTLEVRYDEAGKLIRVAVVRR